LVDVILSYRSIRSHEKKGVPDEVLSKIPEAGRQAPSASNVQPWHFIVLTDCEIKENCLLEWHKDGLIVGRLLLSPLTKAW